MSYVLHSTPSGTPLASPRASAEAEAGGGLGDLEAPLLPGGGGTPPKQLFESGGVFKAITFGLINTCAGVPALIAFCAVVFKDPAYEPWIEPLCKFFFLASAVHQAVVCCLSAVPYAVGQVQDVGLIFLSAMASSIAAACAADGYSAAAALGTSLLTMAVSTFVVGLGLVAVAKAQLASVVQYVPLPAIGGYLSFVGYFCFASGLGLGCGIQLGTLSSWVQLWDAHVAARVAPTLASCFTLMWVMARHKHPAALPLTLLAIVALFHGCLAALGVSLEEAQQAGWLLKPAASTGRFWDLWLLFDLGPGLSLQHIHWSAALQQVGKLLGLFLLVCFGSCMDIAAISSGMNQDSPLRLDFNQELTTIGISNMLSGAVGAGFTGSFIFSQTIWSGRAGVTSRLNGAVIALLEFGMFALPGSGLVQYLPCFFFGSLLLLFGLEIMLDWMLRSYHKLSAAEYALLWATFGAISVFGLEAGIAAGCVGATLFFVFAYSKAQLSNFSLGQGHSGIVRSADQEAALELLRPTHMVAARLRGFLFFGTANAISTRLHAAAKSLEAAGGTSSSGSSSELGGGASLPSGNGAVSPILATSPWRLRGPQRPADRVYGDSSKHNGALFASVAAPKFMVVDFSQVKGLDATAARTLGALFRDLAQLDIAPVVTAARPADIRQLLKAHGVPLPPLPTASAQHAAPASGPSAAAELDSQHCHEFLTYEEGVRFAEQQLLAVAVTCGLCRPPSEAVTLEQLLLAHASQAALPFASREEASSTAAAIQRYCTTRCLQPGEQLWQEGQPADSFWIIEQGRVTVEQLVAGGGGGGATAAAADQQADSGRQRRGSVRVFVFGPGSIAGVVDVFLHRTRSSSAVVGSGGGGDGGGGDGSCRALQISREALGRMAMEAPAALHFLQAVVMRAKILDLGTAADMVAARV
ncbi:hypothetical protein D9Q98_000939 [Chlorella vulgaris]|uniref:Sulfate transporter n=1 Tax=Chlorella vulgaris TaxID=3077 RepID=A0A9D4U0B7_CHLVU|nr:hypothetical protein D9Q98_000939 [Chlorella vulgaris]